LENNLYKKVVFTDLDGTLTLKDTYFSFLLQYVTLKKMMKNILTLIKVVFLYSIKRVSDDKIKIITYKIFFTDIAMVDIESKIPIFIRKIKWNKKILNKINILKEDSYKIYIVTASPDFYVKYICDYLKFDGFISTRAKISEDGKLIGEFNGNVCNFQEKVDRIENSSFFDKNSTSTISFGNSKGDMPMLEFCNESYFVKKYNIRNINNIRGS